MHAQPREEAWLTLAGHDPDALAALLQARPWLVNQLADPEALAEALGAAGYGQLCEEIAFCPGVHRDARSAFRAHGAMAPW